MTESVAVALITGGLALAGNVLSNMTAHGKTIYRIEQLEKKQDKHNNLIERMFLVEGAVELLKEQLKVANHRIEDLEDDEKGGHVS
jgi:type III secretory pathway component EscU